MPHLQFFGRSHVQPCAAIQVVVRSSRSAWPTNGSNGALKFPC